MRFTALAVLTLLLGCRGGRVQGASTELQLGAMQVQFPRTFVGHPTRALIELRNGGKATRSVTLKTQLPFGAEPGPLEVPGGSSLMAELSFSPQEVGDFQRALFVTSEDLVLQAGLLGSAEPIPTCVPSGPCRAAAFDADAARCIETNLPDGLTCASTCLLQAKCSAGSCLGTAKDCDDHDACTTDACEEASGCLHFSALARCGASTNPCRVPICDPQTGCGFVDAQDGTLCGHSDCSSANICLLGVCKLVPAFDGAACGAPSPCQPGGLCQAQTCVQPPAQELVAAWTLWAPAGHHVSWDSIADHSGNVYWRESEPDYSAQRLVSATSAGAPRFSVPIPVSGQLALIEDVLVLRHGDALEARRTADGSLLWSRSFAQPTADEIGAVQLRTIARGFGGTLYLGQSQMSKADPSKLVGSSLSALALATGATVWSVSFPLQLINDQATPVDEGGFVYAGTDGTDGKRRYYGISNTGLVRWMIDNPHSDPAAVFGGRVYHWDHWLSETSTGAWVNTVEPDLFVAGYPRLALGAVSYIGSSIDPVPICGLTGVVDAGATLTLVRVDPATSQQRWRLQIAGPDAGGLAMTNTVLTSNSTILFSQEEDYCGVSGRHVLREVSALGEPGFSCRLPGGEAYVGEGLLNDGRWIAAINDPDGGQEGVRAITLPGFQLPVHGWATAWGSPARDNHAR